MGTGGSHLVTRCSFFHGCTKRTVKTCSGGLEQTHQVDVLLGSRAGAAPGAGKNKVLSPCEKQQHFQAAACLISAGKSEIF